MTHDEFLEAIYRALLGRTPDDVGRPHFLEKLRTGTPPHEVITAILGSLEYLNLLAPKPIVTRCFDFELVIPPDDWMLKQIEETHTYEPHVMAPFLEVADGQVVLDIGANVGVFTIAVARIAVMVVAIEMAPANARYLVASLTLNRISNVELIPVAVSDRLGYATVPRTKFSNKAIVEKMAIDSINAIEIVPTIPLDLIAPADTGVVKIDIEGYEYKALHSANKIFAMHPVFFMEFGLPQCQSTGTSPEALLNLFSDRGYLATILHRDMMREPADLLRIMEAAEQVLSYGTHIDLMMKPR